MNVVLHRTAPWNAKLHLGGTRYTQVGDRRYVAEAGGIGIWYVWTVDHDGLPRDTDGTFDDSMFVVIAFNLAQVRAAIGMHSTGRADPEIQAALLAMPKVGVGRNHPRNVELRRRRTGN